jgi:hypothetical protein
MDLMDLDGESLLVELIAWIDGLGYIVSHD